MIGMQQFSFRAARLNFQTADVVAPYKINYESRWLAGSLYDQED
jgi:hypothetical protein